MLCELRLNALRVQEITQTTKKVFATAPIETGVDSSFSFLFFLQFVENDGKGSGSAWFGVLPLFLCCWGCAGILQYLFAAGSHFQICFFFSYVFLIFFYLFSFSLLQYDVAVYGATASGVLAAAAAANEGASVILLEPGKNVGGMVSGTINININIT